MPSAPQNPPCPRRRATSRRGFTVVEAMVTLGVIALLASILFYALHGAKGAGAETSERATVVSLRMAVEQFKTQFGFLPPLVVDDQATQNGPSARPDGQPVVWSATDLGDPNPAPNSGDNFSIYSLPWYICGSLEGRFDGVEGLGLTEVLKDPRGHFSRKGRAFEPLFKADGAKTRTGVQRLAPNPGASAAGEKVRLVLLDYWSDAAVQVPIRYYRWLPRFVNSGPDKGQVDYYNLPRVVQPGYANGTLAQRRSSPGQYPAPPTQFRDAEFAVVSAGPNRVFGDENVAFLRQTLKLDPATPVSEVERIAAQDNIVEVGK